MKQENLIIVVSAPSGVGKTTVIQYLMSQREDIATSVSATTREPRPGEREGVDYYFISTQEFNDKIKKGEFVEYAQVHDELYGTLHSELQRHINSGKDVILELDVQGMRSIKKKYPQAVTVFMLPPSIKEMELRLKGRGSENEEKIQKRIKRAFEEMKACTEFDYTIVNIKVEQSAYDLNTIINAEHLKSSRVHIKLE
ncbi:MAG TPA: guanylate kinase [Candidatus Hydrogenedens sp.]|nr:guanylate kinase [Candidatus Hydrogenedens sp.]